MKKFDWLCCAKPIMGSVHKLESDLFLKLIYILNVVSHNNNVTLNFITAYNFKLD